MYITAQEFGHEFRASRATTASATRTSYSGGAADGNGLVFPSPTAQAEFERRCRLRSLPESTGSPPAIAACGPDLPYVPAGMSLAPDSAFFILMREDIERFRTRCREAEFEGGAVEFLWRCREPEFRQGLAAAASPVLCQGAFSVLIELFRRYPGDGERDALLTWLESARQLSLLFDRIGVWPLLAEELADNAELAHSIRTMAAFLDLHLGSSYMDYLGLEPGPDAWLHFIHWALNLESVEFHRFEGPDELPELGCRTQHQRILWELQSLPMAASADGDASLFGGVMPLLGSPGAGGFHDDSLAASLFLATCMASADHRQMRGNPWFSWERPYSFAADAQAEAVQGLLAHALAWLGGTLPHFAFSPATEGVIEAASGETRSMSSV